MKHLDLFSGIGGFALAAQWAGIETVAFCEIDKFCHKVLNKNFPGIPIHDDIKTLNGADYAGIDIITGGYPCQPFSTAGKRKGEDDPRHLWPEMFRIIKQARPTWVVCENVAGHITKGLDDVCDDLEGEGYKTQSLVIPACAVEAPNIRSRVWVVAHLHGRGRNTQSQSECPFTLTETDNTDANSTSTTIGGESTWAFEPNVDRVVDGVSRRVDKPRIKALGNAIVPQVAYEILRCIRAV